MDGNHPKRRKDKYNPYTIGTTGDGRHWLTFSDGQRHRHHLEINAAVCFISHQPQFCSAA